MRRARPCRVPAPRGAASSRSRVVSRRAPSTSPSSFATSSRRRLDSLSRSRSSVSSAVARASRGAGASLLDAEGAALRLLEPAPQLGHLVAALAPFRRLRRLRAALLLDRFAQAGELGFERACARVRGAPREQAGAGDEHREPQQRDFAPRHRRLLRPSRRPTLERRGQPFQAPKHAERTDRVGRCERDPAHATGGRGGGAAQRGDGNEKSEHQRELPRFDADVEAGERERDLAGRNAERVERAGEAEAVQQAERERQRERPPHDAAGVAALGAARELEREPDERRGDRHLDAERGHAHDAEARERQRRAVAGREGGHRRDEAAPAQQRDEAGEEEQMVEPAEEMAGAEPHVGGEHGEGALARRHHERRRAPGAAARARGGRRRSGCAPARRCRRRRDR